MPAPAAWTVHRGDDRTVQLTQSAQERVERGLQCRAGVALAGLLLLIAALQIGAGAEGAARTGDHQAAHLVALVVDRIERLGKAAQHVDRDRVHDFLMVELEDRDRSVEVERDVFELHGFLFALLRRLVPQ
jgi:hypothetical protein